MLIIILISILISLIFAPLGCVSLWKRYTYFGDGLSHASLLSGSISIIADIPIIYSGLLLAIIFAVFVFKLKNISGSNAVISLISSFMLAIAFILASITTSQVNINHLLFGDIISASLDDLITLSVLLVVVGCFYIIFYSRILLIVLNRDIAQVRGINVKMIELLFLIILSLAVFLTIKIVGALLVTSILIIPAMAARIIAMTPLQMIIIAVGFALASNLFGLYVSFHLDIPTMPIIIIINVMIYFLLYIFKISKERRFG
jgi:zinc transport system permease protein